MKLEFLFVKGKDDFCQNIQSFKNFLLANNRLVINEKTLQVDHKELSYNIDMYDVEVSKETIFYLSLEAKQEKEEEQVEALECAETVLHRINDAMGHFQINTIWDDVSMYYGRKMYAPIVEVESLLRRIIYTFMLKNVGSKWLKEQSPEEVKNDIQRTLQKNRKDVTYPDTDALMYADFITLGKFFFSKYSLKTDYQYLLQRLKKGTLTDEEVNSLVERYELRSNWERYFAKTISVDNLLEKWTKLYDYRNMVAHDKKITKKDYQEATSITDELKPAFLKSVESLDSINVTEEETEAIETVAEQTIAPKKTNDFAYLWSVPAVVAEIQSINNIKLPQEFFVSAKSCNDFCRATTEQLHVPSYVADTIAKVASSMPKITAYSNEFHLDDRIMQLDDKKEGGEEKD